MPGDLAPASPRPPLKLDRSFVHGNEGVLLPGRYHAEWGVRVGPGDFAENITTEGLDLPGLPVGTRLMMGGLVEVEVSQIGKTCHSRCAIYEQAGYCVMPEEGIFAAVLTGGSLNKGDEVKIIC
mgnify:CR=1 FL=1